MKVLAVEDDSMARAILRRSLEQLESEVIEACDGEEAWTAWLKDKPRVAVSDWQRPRLDGLRLCKRFRAQEGRDYVYFILLTGNGGNAHNRRAAAGGREWTDFLTKPIDMSALWMRLRVARTHPQVHPPVPPAGGDDADVLVLQKDPGRPELLAADRRATSTSGPEPRSAIRCPECYQRVVVPELERLREGAKAAPGHTVRRKR